MGVIRRCSARRDLWNKVPSPARTHPASARADALTARGCSHRHWIGRRRGGHHHVHNPPWPPPPRASAAETAAPRRTASPCTASRPEWHVHAATPVLVHRAAHCSKVAGWRWARTQRCGTLSISHTQVCADLPCSDLAVSQSVVCAVCARATRAMSSFRSRHPRGHGLVTYARFEGKCEL